MDIMESSISGEINNIVTNGIGVLPYVTAVIHTPVGDVDVIDILNYDVMRDYLVQYCDETTAVLLVPRGKLALRVALHPDDLEITITRSSGAVFGASDTNSTTISNRFKVILTNPVDPTLIAGSQKILDEFTMDLQGFDFVSVQLFEPLMQRFAMQTVGGIYRKTTTADIARTLLTKCSQVEDVEKSYEATGIDMVEPDDKTVRDHVLIPHGTMAYDALGYIQKHAGGIYSAGISYYYQNDFWYVFPSFDYSRFNSADRQLIIYRVPEQRMPGIEKTSLVHGSVVSIVATGEMAATNATQNKKLNDGNGVMFADASTLFEKGVSVENNRARVARGRNNNEFVSSVQTDGLNKRVMASERITANKLQQASVLAAREGMEVQLMWQNANIDLLTPGMQTRLYYLRDGIIRESQAVLIGVQGSVATRGQGLVNRQKNSTAALRLWVDTSES